MRDDERIRIGLRLQRALKSLHEAREAVQEVLEEVARPEDVPPPPDAFDMGRFWWEAPQAPEETADAPPSSLAGGKPGA